MVSPSSLALAGILEWKLGAGIARKKKLRGEGHFRDLLRLRFLFLRRNFFIHLHLPPHPYLPFAPKMSGTDAANPSGIITSSADRMVGAEHAEVRYFTRYDFRISLWLSTVGKTLTEL